MLYTKNGRELKYYGERKNQKLDELFLKLIRCYDWETAAPGCQERYNYNDNPTDGQCSITALIVNDLFGGTIRCVKLGGGTHYFNEIEGEYFDLTRDQFWCKGMEIEDEPNEVVKRDYCLSNADTKKRYEILNERLKKEQLRAFVALKFYNGETSRSLIDGITEALRPLGIETFVAVRDIEKYGEVTGLDMANFMPKYVFPEIEKSDLMIIEFSEKGVGLGIGACHAYDFGVPVYLIAKPGSDISTTINSIATDVIFYKDYEDLRLQFEKLIRAGELKIKA